jgi:PAS domain S-box-containing protein
MQHEQSSGDDSTVSQDDLCVLRRQIADLQRQHASDQQELNALRIERDFFRVIADFTYDWDYWRLPDASLHYVSPACQQLTGYSPDEFQRDPNLLERIMHPDDQETVTSHLHDELCSQERYELEFRIITRSGETRWFWHVCQPVYSPTGAWLGRRADNRDITVQKQAEADLRVSETRYHTLAKNFPGVVFLFDQEMRYLVADGQELAMVGMTPAMLEGKTLYEATPPEIAEIGAPLYRAILDGTAPPAVEQHYGDQVFHTQPISLRDDQGRIVAGMIISQNITERKQAEAALRENQRFVQRIADIAPYMIYIFDLVAVTNTFVNNYGLALGWPSSAVPWRSCGSANRNCLPRDCIRTICNSLQRFRINGPPPRMARFSFASIACRTPPATGAGSVAMK